MTSTPPDDVNIKVFVDVDAPEEHVITEDTEQPRLLANFHAKRMI